MEYWIGSSLSDNVTQVILEVFCIDKCKVLVKQLYKLTLLLQDDITNFRFKLPAILWDSRLNTKEGYQQPEQTIEVIDSPSDVEIIDAPDEFPKPPNASQQMESDASPNVLSSRVRSIKMQELLYILSNYIISKDNNAEILQ